MKLALALLLLAAACSDRDRPARDREPERQRRVIEPPSRGVRALPPHAIRAEGVGPFKIGATAAELIDQLPSGPRITQFLIPGVVRRDILRAEGDAILIGAEPQGKATFVAVVRGEIARTEAGVHVGSSRDELVRALGGPAEDPDRARDPRVFVPSSMRNARVVLASDHITAFVITNESPPAKDAPPVESACTRPVADASKHELGACLTTAGELVRVADKEVSVIGRDSEKPISIRIPGLVFAAPLRNPSDGRDDLVAITHTDDGQTRTWSLVALRFTDGKLVRVIEPTVLYQLTSANSRWIGAELRDLDLILEVASRADSIEVGGLLTTRIGDKVRDIVVISPVPVARRRTKPTPHEASDAGTPDSSLIEHAPR